MFDCGVDFGSKFDAAIFILMELSEVSLRLIDCDHPK